MIQKIIKISNRAAVIIPTEFLEELGIKVGDSVSITVDKKKRLIVIKPA